MVPGTSPLGSHTGSFSLLEFSRMLHTLILGGERPILTPYPDPDRSIYLGVSLDLSTPSCHVSPP